MRVHSIVLGPGNMQKLDEHLMLKFLLAKMECDAQTLVDFRGGDSTPTSHCLPATRR